MTSPSGNHNLAIIPVEYQESPFILPYVMLIDFFGVAHLAYPLMENASIRGDERIWSLVSDIGENMDSYCKGELKSSKGHVYTTFSDDDDTLLVKAMQRDLDAILLTKSTKKSYGKKSKFIPPENPIDIIDNVIETKKDRKRKRTAFMGNSKEQVTLSKSVLGELLILLQAHGWNALFLQGNRRRKMGRKETREFYINAVGSASSISSKVLSKILVVPNVGWCDYVKRTWPLLEGLSSALEISRRFANDPMLEDYTRVDKRSMLPLHKLIFYVLHKIILPRSQKRTEANYLDLTLMELLISKVQINLHQLVLSHIHRILFKYFRIQVKDWQEQTTKNVLGEVDHVVIPATSRGANAPVQRLKALLTTKNDEIAALKVSHSAVMDQLHISYSLKHAGLVKENSRLKEELAKTQAALETAILKLTSTEVYY
ncbi:hypothetical protein R3W88_023124 [Solanum pinnatisectum]|uniref:Uncharacterized protein n=1 Tax=Solanum pinnatisectum TaxID=50273 RepID=A0AAV9LWK4_9SOLN|nr:hypothetical protein R3W88_023124 [Solanum pinnatisectum]